MFSSEHFLVFENGELTHDLSHGVLWDGLYSKASRTGAIMQFVQKCLRGSNSIMFIPRSDGNLFNCSAMAPYLERAKQLKVPFILGTLAQTQDKRDIDPYIQYLYLPLDDDIFVRGLTQCISQPKGWEDKTNELIWRGGCSGEGRRTIRIRFTEMMYQTHPQIRLSTWWSEGKQIDPKMFGPRISPIELMKSKIFFIIDGAVIASNHMWGFATNSVPVIISDATCWFTKYAQPGIHFIPVKFDLSDLDQQIKWIQTHDNEAKQIAINAMHFSKTIFSAEFQQQYLQQGIADCLSLTSPQT